MGRELIVGALFVLGTVALVWITYLVGRAISAREVSQETKELASSVVFRVSALHGLILALVFAQEMGAYRDLQVEIMREATALADIYHDVTRHGSEASAEVHEALDRYVSVVLDSEWRQLADGGRLSASAWAAWEQVYDTVLDLEGETLRERSLRDHMLDGVHLVAEMRDRRESHGLGVHTAPFWFAAVSGLILVALPYCCFRPSGYHLALLTVFGAYTGVVFFLIFSFSNPFAGIGGLEPSALHRFQVEVIQQ